MFTYRNARRVVIFVIGATVALTGIALLVLPGPGVVVIVLGLAILATEFAWAHRWLERIKERAGDARNSVSTWLNSKPPATADRHADDEPHNARPT